MTITLRNQIGSFLFACFAAVLIAGQAPGVEKIDPPSWWVGSTIDPVRVLIKGRNLAGARIESATPGITASNFMTSANGNYLFADLRLAETVRSGNYQLRVVTSGGSVNAPFEVFTPQPRLGNYNGFMPDDVIYFVFTDRFADGDPTNNDPQKSKGLYDRKKGRHYHGGDLQGIIEKLAYIRSLGATAIWTTPVYDNADREDTLETYPPEMPTTTGFHGYGAVDFYGVDEHLGDMAKLREFVRKAHQAGFVVLQDQVVNHTGPYHPWANDPPTPNWFNGTVDKHESNNWQKWTAMNPRATFQTQRRNIDGWFIDILPDLNQTNPEVEKYLIQNSLWWIAQVGFDSIRMDTLPHVPRSFWSKWGSAVHREFPKVNILGELFDSDPVLLSYFQKGRRGHDGIDPEIDTLYDFGLFYPIRNAFAQGKPIREIHQMFARDWLYPKPNVLVTFLGVHDMPRFMNEPGATTTGLKLAQTLIMTSRGTPLLYYGDEIAMPGGADPDNRRDFPGGFPGDVRNAFTSAGRTADENDVWNHLAKLGSLRKAIEPLRRGRSLDLFDAEQQYAYARLTDKEAAVVIFNNDTRPAEVVFDISFISKQIATDATLRDALGSLSDLKVNDGKVKATIPARSAGIYVVK
ncbi:MAG: cyclomaltodextrinase N-terminal domain-containing protein [Blastocatellia bacterium]|nr:cyclomaltodextrinase N-terminal domain-containing protein [Blastocatellia bacterium]